MILETMRRAGADARLLLARCQAAVRRHAGAVSARDDVVHWDFTNANVLVDADRVTGVIDWDGTCSGDALFDVATLFYYTRDERLRDYVVERAGSRALALYLAHLCIRQAEWSLRLHAPEAGRAMVRYGLELSESFG